MPRDRMLNFDDLVVEPEPDKPPRIIPEGQYKAMAVGCEDRISKASQQEYCLFAVQILEPKVHDDFRLYIAISWEHRAWWKWLDLIKAAGTGSRGNKHVPTGPFRFNPEWVLFNPFWVKVRDVRYGEMGPQSYIASFGPLPE
jgi:hypothetical protein